MVISSGQPCGLAMYCRKRCSPTATAAADIGTLNTWQGFWKAARLTCHEVAYRLLQQQHSLLGVAMHASARQVLYQIYDAICR